jgi:hypothetical protein
MNLAITAIFQNEAPYLKEWIEFHLLMGAEHFYLKEKPKAAYFKSSDIRARKAASLRNILGWSMLVFLKISYMEVPNGKLKQ